MLIDFNQNFMQYASSRPGVDQLIEDLDRISLPLFWRLTCGLALMILHARASSKQNAFNCDIYIIQPQGISLRFKTV